MVCRKQVERRKKANMNESRIANKIVMAAAGPLTLLEQIQDDLRRGKLEDYRYLNMVGNGWGHTPGTDYIFGQAGEDIAYALIGFASGHKGKDEVLSIIRRNIQQALRDNEPFRGLRGEERATHELWMRMMKHGKAAGIKTAAIEEGDVCTVDMREAQRLLGSDVPSTHQMRIIRDVVRQGGGRVVIEEVRGDTAQVSAHDNPMSRIMGMVDVPLRALRKIASITAAGKGYQEWRDEARRDRKLKDILDRGWELNVIKQTMNALNTGSAEGLRNVRDRDFVKDLTEYLKGRKGSINREAVSRELVAIVQDLVALEGTRLTLVRNPSTDEWIVKVFVNGKYDEGKTYYTDDKQDAINTMKQMKKEMGIIAAEEFPDTAEDIAWDVVTRMVNKRMSVDEALRNIGYGGLIRNTRTHEMPVGWESLPTEKMVKVMTPAIQRALNRSMSAAETFKCPNCGTKVLKNTGYCLKCKEKVKEAAGR